jgi:hypothetical protein
VLVAYTLAMAFVLVYFAEHYVFDVFVGWAYAVVSYVVVGAVLDRRRTGPRAVASVAAGSAPLEEVAETRE